ncbi:MAG: ABC transporter permease [Oscillospiraceae bacterium]|nr:ABC transporter permease [Oscillospiraceae bacterium]
MSREQGRWKLGKGRIAVCILLSVLAVCSALFLRHITAMLPSEQAADRWAGGTGRFAQVTAFLPEHGGLTVGQTDGLAMAIQSGLVTQGIMPDEPGGLPTHAYSAEGVLSTSTRDRGPVETFATGVGGNFFVFHPVQLVSGSYLPVESLNRDLVVIDETLAWSLFGATDVAGLELVMEGQTFHIVGVYRPLNNFASQAADGTLPHMFLYYDAMTELLGPVPITTVMTVLPNPITGLGEYVFREAIEVGGMDEDGYALVVNTYRYRLGALWGVIWDFGHRSMYQGGLRLPQWENAARMVEDFAALALLFILLFLLYPILMMIRLGISAFRHRRWRLGRKIYNTFDQHREQKREEIWRESGQTEPEHDLQFDIDEIIRSVRESEEYHETKH